MIWTEEEIEEILADEDFDISAIYVLGPGKFNLNSPETNEKIDRAIQGAMKDVRRKHKESGVPMVVEKDGKIVYIQPEDIVVD
ncbi:MAG: hypothetical protein KF736_06805 [Acidobacteria bacterium]|nr:hypothetical protein [Acidobacteriota bacterium]MCW5949177.1 hypothetical protein [Pyrinomonadaceae bacterium]